MSRLLRHLPLRGLSIRQQLLGGFAVDLLLMMLLGTFALIQMGVVRHQADIVATHTLPSMRNVDRIQNLVSDYRRLQLEMALYSNEGDRARTEVELLEVERKMQQCLDVQSRFLRRDVEQRAFDGFKSLWLDYVHATHSKYVPAIRRGNTGTVQPALSRLNPVHHRLTQATAELKRLGSADADQAMTVLQETQRTSRSFILADTTVSLAISAFVGLMLAATLSDRIRNLTSATRRVAAGDLETHAIAGDQPVMRDELGFLAANFDKMVESLRLQRETLETRHRELGASLEEQRRLTEDLMRRKEAEEAAYRGRAEAEARDSAKSAFLATMSHELRTPLNAVLGYVQLMRLEAEAKGDAEPLEDLKRITSAGKHLATLINNLLDFSKIEQGKMEVEIITFSLETLIRDVVAVIQPLVRKENNVLELHLSNDLGSMTSDSTKLGQILFNLLSNAAKFTENGRITLTVDRRSGVDPEQPDRDFFCIQVADTGIGIHPEHMDVIFEPFRQADNSISRRFGGTGLGLVICRRLSELLGGMLSVESVLDEGSCFSVLLPAIVSPDALSTERPSSSEPGLPETGHAVL